MITLQKLITIAPFSDEMRKELLEKQGELSDERKFALEELCWGLISQWYHTEVESRSQIALLESAKNELEKKEETQQSQSKDVTKIPEEVFAELIAKLEVVSSADEIQEVRKKLATINLP